MVEIKMDRTKTGKPEAETPSTPTPPAGPHAKPELTNDDATPGAGVLPDKKSSDVDGGAG